MKKTFYISMVTALFFLGGCSPEVGSKAWCEDLDEKPRGEWTANEIGDYAKHCMFRSDD